MAGNASEGTPLITDSRNGSQHEHEVMKKGSDKCSTPERSFKSKFVESVIIIVAYSTQGALSSLTGPTLPDLQVLTSSSTEAIAGVITGDFGGQLVSCAVVAYVLARLNYTPVLFLSLALMAAMTAVVPWCPGVSSMIAVFAIRGFSSGFVGIGLNAAMIWIWGLKNGPYMQTLYMSFSIGALCSPLIAELFVSTTVTTETIGWNVTQNGSVYMSIPTAVQQGEDTESRVYIPYTIFAVWCLSCAMMFLIRCVVVRQFLATGSTSHEDMTLSLGEPHRQWFYICRIGIVAYTIVVSMVIIGVSGTLSLFVVQYLNWSPADGALITTVFWATLSIGRGSMVWALHFWSLDIIMILSSVIALIFFIVLCVVNPLTSSIAWASVALIGLGLGSLGPGVWSWYAQEVPVVTSLMAAIVMGSSSFGGAISPMILGYLFHYATPMWFCYLLCGVHAISLILFIFLCIASHIWNRGHHGYVTMAGRTLEYETMISEDTSPARK